MISISLVCAGELSNYETSVSNSNDDLMFILLVCVNELSNRKIPVSLQTFNDLDTDHDGKLDMHEFDEYGWFFMTDSMWNGYPVETAIECEWDNLESDGDGFISYNEFKEMF
ncbi:EF-hand domain-containing protein [uncultured Methanobrevibacter sp.]|uniref:EF-hand domain-containing protein n=1 Tax=uncultured Methanobrevibacter sp. TaxID=253161 RepID=UPI0026101F6F|nr:EF-hand domain-containing protein [uncultured Methanobrevibacter sp.]